MLDLAGGEAARQIELVDDALGIAVARVRAPPHLAGAIDVAGRIVRQSEDVRLVITGIARGVAQRHAAEIMLDPNRRLVGLCVAEIAVGEAVEGRARHEAGLAVGGGDLPDRGAGADVAGARRIADRVEIRDAAVGQIVAFEVIVTDRQTRRRAEPEREAGGHAPAPLIDRITPRDILIVPQAGDAEGGGVAELHVEIGRHALVIGIAIAGGDRTEGLGLRNLGEDVDRSAGIAAPAQRRIRSAHDLHRIDREHFAILCAKVAHAIDEDAALTVEAADEGPIADRIAALGRTEGDAGHGAQGIGERGRSGLLDH